MAFCLLFPLLGNSNQHYRNDENETVVSSIKGGGPGFKAFMRLFDQTEENIKNCKTCDELEAVLEKFLDDMTKLLDRYSDDEMTEAEEDRLDQRLEELGELIDTQELKLCGNSLDDDGEGQGEQFQNNGKGNPAYLEMMDLMDDFEKQLNKCTSCERLTVLINRFSEDCKEVQKKYGEDVDITEWEEDRIDERFDEIGELLEKKYKQLCDD